MISNFFFMFKLGFFILVNVLENVDFESIVVELDVLD